MIRDWRHLVGVVLGLAMFAGALTALQHCSPPPRQDLLREQGPILSDCHGALRELVIHYVPEARDAVLTTYRDFLRQLPENVQVNVVCPDRSALDELLQDLGEMRCRLVPVITGHPMTTWSRDRWLALPPAAGFHDTLLLRPYSEDGAPVWPARAGDYRTAEDLAAARPGELRAGRCRLYFDGGDFAVDQDLVLVTPDVRRRNADYSETEIKELLTAMLDKEVLLLSTAPPHHAGMFLMPVGNRTIVVGDPSLAKPWFSQPDIAALLPAPDFSEATQTLFDDVARQLTAAGYRVVRIPVAPDQDQRTYLSYVNVILDERAGKRLVYLPVFRGAEPLNDAAAAVWRDLGYEVRPVDCTGCYRQFGTLRCLVNVLSRG